MGGEQTEREKWTNEKWDGIQGGRKEKMEREFLKRVEGSGREETDREKQKGEKWEVKEGRGRKGNSGRGMKKEAV